jgi:RNA polymerase sigma-70 factor, ECF subfamily
MEDQNWLAQRFEERRHHLRAVAYRMLGSLTEAEDAVQEAWLRLNRSETSTIANLDGWLTTVVGRVCLDVLRTRKARREETLDAVPEMVVSSEDGMDPERDALIADSVGIALLVVLEALAPPERLAFVLHDMFAVPFEEIAGIVGCSPVAARKLASRARSRVRGEAPVPDVGLKQQRKIVDAFFAAVRSGDLLALVAVLDPNVVVRSDYGTLREIRGARAAAEGALMFSHLVDGIRPVLVNGVAGIVSRHPSGQVFAVMCFIVKGGSIVEIDIIRDPDRLRNLDLTGLN